MKLIATSLEELMKFTTHLFAIMQIFSEIIEKSENANLYYINLNLQRIVFPSF